MRDISHVPSDCIILVWCQLQGQLTETTSDEHHKSLPCHSQQYAAWIQWHQYIACSLGLPGILIFSSIFPSLLLCVQVFSELDDKLQQAFTTYLEERGVNAELGRFVMDFSEDKEQREYMHWLQGVQKFLKQ